MTTYTAVISRIDHHNGVANDEELALPSRTDNEASEATAKIAAEHVDAQVFCRFDRDSDGQAGYINRDGADVTGRAY